MNKKTKTNKQTKKRSAQKEHSSAPVLLATFSMIQVFPIREKHGLFGWVKKFIQCFRLIFLAVLQLLPTFVISLKASRITCFSAVIWVFLFFPWYLKSDFEHRRIQPLKNWEF
jgi:hypothetical protein